jgi:4-amino-4-deoxy-L-arabinose transferase-like glycosyltransferase
MAFFLRLKMAMLDPFLNPWDERFHALVARNMMDQPFKPMLLREFMGTTPVNDWAQAHIWLHKQPLFLWQMALSMKIFGVSEFTMRLPSVIMGALSVALLYRITIIATSNRTIALMAGAFMCFAYFQLAQISGRLSVDHPDVAFCFYVLASIWCYFEYVHSGNKKFKWVLFIGIMAACAILCKWLTGLLVFSVWGIVVLHQIIKHKNYKQVSHFAIALLVCTVVVLPWQIYILNTFPVEAQFEYAYNSRHFTEAVEGHGGDALFYLNNLDYVFGKNVWLIPVVCLVLLVFNKARLKNFYVRACLAFVFIIHIFFSIAATKMHGYVFCVYPFLFLFTAISLHDIVSRFQYQKIVLVTTSIFICVALLQYNYIQYYTLPSAYRQARIHNTNIYKNLRQYVPADVKYIFNVANREQFDLMFYNADVHAWHQFLDTAYMKNYEMRGVKMAAFKSTDSLCNAKCFTANVNCTIVEEPLWY